MPKLQRLVGFDIGACRIKIADCDENGVPDQVAAVKMPDGMLENGRVVSYEAMGDFIRETAAQIGLNSRNVALALPLDATYVRRVKLPLMTIAQLRVNLPYEFHDYITQDLDQYFYDYAVIAIDENNKTMELMAVAVEKKLMTQYRAMFKRAGLTLKLAAPGVLALQRLLEVHEDDTTYEDGALDYAVLDLAHTTFKLHFFSDGQYEITRAMNAGGRDIVKIISDVTGSDAHIAQLYEEENHDDILHQEKVTDVFDQMAVEIMRVLNFYSFNNPDNRIKTLYVCGGGAAVPPLLKAIAQTVGLPLAPITDLIADVNKPDREDAKNLLLGPQALGIVWE